VIVVGLRLRLRTLGACIVVMVFGGLTFLAARNWRARGGGTVASMPAAFDGCAEQIGPALAGH
jgi:hypothetical protein